jgi:hypothetical protein
MLIIRLPLNEAYSGPNGSSNDGLGLLNFLNLLMSNDS